MADLTAYMNFNVALNKSANTPVINITNASAYPSGVSAAIISTTFSITQPDNISTSTTSLTGELRLATDGNLQKGLYTIVMSVVHPSYDNSDLTKSFSLYYEPAILSLNPGLDVFTPLLKIYDQTKYAITNFNAPSIVRAWYANINGVGTITGGDSSEFDLANDDDFYYDAKYDVQLFATVTYPVKGAVWATVVDRLSTSKSYKTEVPLNLNDLYVQLTAYKLKYVKEDCCKQYPDAKQNYIYAFTLFQHFIMRGNCGANRMDIRDMIDEIYQVLNNGVNPIYKNTNEAIQPYSFTDFCGCGCDSGSSTTALTITTQPATQTVTEGAEVTLSVVATGGVPPYSYQWRLNQTNISGATSSTYHIQAAASGNAGIYDVMVSSSDGSSLPSNTATLTVNQSQATVQVIYGWSTTNPYVSDNTDITVTNPTTVTVNHNADLSLTFPQAAPDNYIEVKVPAGESLKNLFNNGTNTLVGNVVPADEFRRYTYNGFTYYIARNPLGFVYTQPLNFLQ